MDPQSNLLLQTTGCSWLSPISLFLGIPLDQVNFIMCQMFGLAAACWFRLFLHPERVGPAVRHVIASVLGSFFVIFCFGWYSSHVFVLTLISYVILHRASTRTVHWYSMIAAMGYLTVCQVSRVFIFNYGVPATDFSGWVSKRWRHRFSYNLVANGRRAKTIQPNSARRKDESHGRRKEI